MLHRLFEYMRGSFQDCSKGMTFRFGGQATGGNDCENADTQLGKLGTGNKELRVLPAKCWGTPT